MTSTLVDARVTIEHDPQPHYVMQWFPTSVRTASEYGDDPRKHAVSLCFALDLGSEISVREGGEGDAVAWFAPGELTDVELWPGAAHLIHRTLAGAGIADG